MLDPRETPDFRHAVARKLREIRLQRKMSQERLAFLAGIHPTYVSMLENGRKSPTVDALEKISRALEVRPSSILAGAERLCEQLRHDG